MKIYKVKAFVNFMNRKEIESVHNTEQVIIDDLKSARVLFEQEKCILAQYKDLAGHGGRVELFEPHVFENGTLAYWPDSEIGYIDRWEFHRCR